MTVQIENRKKIASALRGVTQSEIAEQANVSQQVISNYFNGTLNENIVSQNTIEKIETAIKVLAIQKKQDIDSILLV